MQLTASKEIICVTTPHPDEYDRALIGELVTTHISYVGSVVGGPWLIHGSNELKIQLGLAILEENMGCYKKFLSFH